MSSAERGLEGWDLEFVQADRICCKQRVLRKCFLNARQGIRDNSRLLLEFRRETRENLRRRTRAQSFRERETSIICSEYCSAQNESAQGKSTQQIK